MNGAVPAARRTAYYPSSDHREERRQYGCEVPDRPTGSVGAHCDTGSVVPHRLISGGMIAAGVLTAAVLAPSRASTTAAPGSSASLQSLLDSPGIDLPFNPQLAAVLCPVERGPVKEGSDLDRYKVSTTVTKVSVAYLRGRAKPSTYPKSHRVTSTELHTYQVTAYLTQYKQEADGDIHLVLKDSAGRRMISEIPYPACVPAASRWKAKITNVRTTFTNKYHVTTSWHYVHRPVDVRGIGYMDPLHGQTGVAPNGVELHPVIYIYFH